MEESDTRGETAAYLGSWSLAELAVMPTVKWFSRQLAGLCQAMTLVRRIIVVRVPGSAQ